MIVRIALYFVPMCDRHLIISIILGILGQHMRRIIRNYESTIPWSSSSNLCFSPNCTMRDALSVFMLICMRSMLRLPLHSKRCVPTLRPCFHQRGLLRFLGIRRLLGLLGLLGLLRLGTLVLLGLLTLSLPFTGCARFAPTQVRAASR